MRGFNSKLSDAAEALAIPLLTVTRVRRQIKVLECLQERSRFSSKVQETDVRPTSCQGPLKRSRAPRSRTSHRERVVYCSPDILNRIRYEDPGNVQRWRALEDDLEFAFACDDDDPSRDATLNIEVSIAGVCIYPCVDVHAVKRTCACFPSNFVKLRELFLSKTLYAFRFRLSFFFFASLAHFPPFSSPSHFETTPEDNSRRNAAGTNVRIRYLLHCPS